MSASEAWLARRAALYSNEVDLPVLRQMLGEVNATLCPSGAADTEQIVAMNAGLNLGTLAKLFVDACPRAHLYGFEVQRKLYAGNAAAFRPYPNAHIFNLGLSDREETLNISMPGNAHGGAGLWQPVGRWRRSRRVGSSRTVALRAFAREHHLRRVDYLALDVEGFEPRVIDGMDLCDGARVFSAFQWEAGGTWLDERHPAGARDREAQLSQLAACGYVSHLIGLSRPCDGKQLFTSSRHHSMGRCGHGSYFPQVTAMRDGGRSSS